MTTASALLEERGPSLLQLGTAVSPVADPYHAGSRILNPAAGTTITGFTVSAGFSRSFDLPEFDRFQLATAAPFGDVTAGGWLSGFGQTLYSERTAGLNVSYPLPGSLQIGAGLSVTQVQVKNYGNDNAFSGDLGMFYAARNWSVGASALNLLSTPLQTFADDHPPRIVHLAGRYAPIDKLTLLAELEWMENHDLTVRAGTEIWMLDALAIRAGYDSAPERIHLGLALRWSGLTGMGAYDYHPWLGWSHAFGMHWQQHPVAP
ncbi:conjugal transfer protein TraF [bacterium]|nr:conjugal transfer protein TraF [bacterium]